MDERKSIIRGLEEKKRGDTDGRARLLEGLGQALIQRIGESASFPAEVETILAEHRALQTEIAGSNESIKSLEADSQRLKALDDSIAAKEAENTQLAKEFAESCTSLGKALLGEAELSDFAASYRQQEQALIAKIDEQEQKAQELQEREGGVFVWLGKNAQMAVSKALLLKNRSALQKIYRSAGEQFFAAPPAEALSGETAAAVQSAAGIKERTDWLGADLAALRAERRKLADSFGAEGSPSRRIQGLQKRITFIKESFPELYLRLGSLAAKTEGKAALTSVLNEEDEAVLEKAALHQTLIDESELKIKKLRAAISIDSEKAEIEKIRKAIANQRQKIAAAYEEIGELEKQISDAEHNIDELQAFLKANE